MFGGGIVSHEHCQMQQHFLSTDGPWATINDVDCNILVLIKH
jgi:hypothetical protein